MNLQDIKTAMQLYASKCNQQGLATMQGWYNQKNVFSYARDNANQPVPPLNEAFVHAYPGIVNNELVIFVISGNKDVANNPNIASDVQVCSTSWNDPTNQNTPNTGTGIPPQQALGMISNWIDNYPQWITANISNLFQGFAIPQADTSFGTQHNAYFALNQAAGAPGGYVADVVLIDNQSGAIAYFDTAQPVPPYPPAVGGAAAFYLLGLIS